MEFSGPGICLGIVIGIPIGALGWWFVLAMCDSAARADQANKEAMLNMKKNPNIPPLPKPIPPSRFKQY